MAYPTLVFSAIGTNTGANMHVAPTANMSAAQPRSMLVSQEIQVEEPHIWVDDPFDAAAEQAEARRDAMDDDFTPPQLKRKPSGPEAPTRSKKAKTSDPSSAAPAVELSMKHSLEDDSGLIYPECSEEIQLERVRLVEAIVKIWGQEWPVDTLRPAQAGSTDADNQKPLRPLDWEVTMLECVLELAEVATQKEMIEARITARITARQALFRAFSDRKWTSGGDDCMTTDDLKAAIQSLHDSKSTVHEPPGDTVTNLDIPGICTLIELSNKMLKNAEKAKDYESRRFRDAQKIQGLLGC